MVTFDSDWFLFVRNCFRSVPLGINLSQFRSKTKQSEAQITNLRPGPATQNPPVKDPTPYHPQGPATATAKSAISEAKPRGLAGGEGANSTCAAPKGARDKIKNILDLAGRSGLCPPGDPSRKVGGKASQPFLLHLHGCRRRETNPQFPFEEGTQREMI